MRISDWSSDVCSSDLNGVVRTLQATTQALRLKGHILEFVSPCDFRSIPCPTYPEIRLALTRTKVVGQAIEAFAPDCIHIATEGPLGLAARRWGLEKRYRFQTAYHTPFPAYISALTTPNRTTSCRERMC